MPRPLLVATALLAGLIAVLAAWQVGTLWSPTAPERFPARPVGAGDLPGVWVFVRSGCPHCHEHLRALQVAAGSLPDSTRRRALGRVHVCGDVLPATPRVHRHPLSLHAKLGVRSTPTTWFVAADSTVCEAWRGARNARAWARALTFVLAVEETP